MQTRWVAVTVAAIGCAGGEDSVDPVDSGSWGVECGLFAPPEVVLDATDPEAVLVADGVPVEIVSDETFRRVEVDPAGAAEVAVFYSGPNSITATFRSDAQEELLGCVEVWTECPGLTSRGVAIAEGTTLELEVGAHVQSMWIVAMDRAGAPGPCASAE